MNAATDLQAHWDSMYRRKGPAGVSWAAPHLQTSLELIEQSGLGPQAAVVDVGAGASSLATDLAARGWASVTAVDWAQTAIDEAKKLAGSHAHRIQWLTADVLKLPLPDASADLWHDRAVFHFLTSPDDRAQYVAQLLRVVRPNGKVIIGSFGPDGPEQCSGLPVVRYSEQSLLATFGSHFERERCLPETHVTPWGTAQAFVYCLCRVVS